MIEHSKIEDSKIKINDLKNIIRTWNIREKIKHKITDWKITEKHSNVHLF